MISMPLYYHKWRLYNGLRMFIYEEGKLSDIGLFVILGLGGSKTSEAFSVMTEETSDVSFFSFLLLSQLLITCS